MAKNRKNIAAAVRFGPALKAFLACAVLVGAGVGYVWQKKQIHDLGQQIGERQVRLKKMQDQNGKLKIQVATLHSPAALLWRIQQMKLGLVAPQQSQILRLAEPLPALETAAETATASPRRYAARGQDPQQ